MESLELADFNFEDGKLLISVGKREMQIAWSPEPTAKERTDSGRWKEFYPDFRLVAPAEEMLKPADADERTLNKIKAFEAFRAIVPDNIATRAFAFSSHQWMFMKLCANDKLFSDLADANHVLAWCLANNFELKSLRPNIAAEQALYYSRRRQKCILQWLGFPDNQAVVKFFKKIRPDASLLPSIRALRAVLRSDPERIKILSHYKIITSEMMAMLNPRFTNHITPALIADIAGQPVDPWQDSTADLLMDVVYFLEKFPTEQKARKFTSVQKVYNYRNELAVRYEEAEALRREAERKREKVDGFPVAPLPGTDDIVPITSKAGLKAEGNEQSNCVGSYARQVMANHTYIYKVLRPMRATLSIVRGSDCNWRIGQLRASLNGPVDHRTVETVQKWLAPYMMGI